MSPRIGQTLVSPEGRRFRVAAWGGFNSRSQSILRLQRLDRRPREQASVWRTEAEVEDWASRILEDLHAGGAQHERPVRLTTHNGSTVEISGKHKGIFKIGFDWCEEDRACIDCEVDIDASRDTGWTQLIWGCCECTGGQAPLAPEEA